MEDVVTVSFFFIEVAGVTMSLQVVDLRTSLRPQQARLAFRRSGLNYFCRRSLQLEEEYAKRANQPKNNDYVCTASSDLLREDTTRRTAPDSAKAEGSSIVDEPGEG